MDAFDEFLNDYAEQCALDGIEPLPRDKVALLLQLIIDGLVVCDEMVH